MPPLVQGQISLMPILRGQISTSRLSARKHLSVPPLSVQRCDEARRRYFSSLLLSARMHTLTILFSGVRHFSVPPILLRGQNLYPPLFGCSQTLMLPSSEQMWTLASLVLPRGQTLKPPSAAMLRLPEIK